MLFATQAWTNFSHNIPVLVLLGVFVVTAITFVTIVLILRRARNLHQTVAKTLDLVTDIRKTPLPYKLIHVNDVVENSGQFKKEFMFWRTRFEIIYERLFVKNATAFFDLFNEKKNLTPTRKNVATFNELYLELRTRVGQSGIDLLEEIDNLLEPEMIYRDYFVKINNLYLKLCDEMKALRISEYLESSNKLENRIETINDLLIDFYNTLNDGKWEELTDYAGNLNNGIAHLTLLVDFLPYILTQNERVIPNKMVELKDRYITFNKDKKNLKSRADKYHILSLEVEKNRILIYQQIQALQYIRAQKTLNHVRSLIKEFETYANFEESVQQKLSEFTEPINEILECIGVSVAQLRRKYKAIIDYKKNDRDLFDFEDLANNITQIFNEWTVLVGNLDGSIATREINFVDVKQQIVSLLENYLNVILQIKKYEQKINRSGMDKVGMINNLIITEAFLNQIEVKILQFHSINSLKKFNSEIDHLKSAINTSIKSNINTMESTAESDLVKEELKSIYNETIEISKKVLNQILFDFLAQEVIVYLNRFPPKDNNEKYESFVQRCVKWYYDGKYKAIFDNAIDILMQLRNAR